MTCVSYLQCVSGCLGALAGLTAVTAARAELEGLVGSLQEAGTAVSVTQRSTEEAAAALKIARDQAHILERNWNSVELGRREVEIKREALEDSTLTELELDLGACYAAHLEARALPGWVATDRAAAE